MLMPLSLSPAFLSISLTHYKVVKMVTKGFIYQSSNFRFRHLILCISNDVGAGFH